MLTNLLNRISLKPRYIGRHRAATVAANSGGAPPARDDERRDS